ncbi:MAG: ornithine carbamoyltransferase [Candidatus Omnitrophica bacterium]|nr:ornithine carbamoyltransferase [Candidatus Omnitrophota bacterium]
MKYHKKDLISIKDLTKAQISKLFSTTKVLKKKPLAKYNSLKGKSLALVFQKPSNRTRVSFEVGMFQLGGKAIYLGPDELKLGVRESVKDIARVLGRYVDGIVARTFKHQNVVDMSKFSWLPVINGLSDLLHPCQGLSDLFTVEEKFGNKKVKISFVGDGNNVLHSLLLGCGILGRDICVATPKGCEPNGEILKEAKKYAEANKSVIEIVNDPKKCVDRADVIYTDVWVSMGQESEKQKRTELFKGFQVNEELVSCAKKGALIMHCLPAHRGEEIADNVLDSDNSIVYEQAENRLHVQKAILLMLLGG